LQPNNTNADHEIMVRVLLLNGLGTGLDHSSLTPVPAIISTHFRWGRLGRVARFRRLLTLGPDV
jgi:hypothetical protein